MLTKDVTVGSKLFARVGGELVQVSVVTVREPAFGRGKRFVVRRVDTGTTLPKARTAAALHRSKDPMGERSTLDYRTGEGARLLAVHNDATPPGSACDKACPWCAK